MAVDLGLQDALQTRSIGDEHMNWLARTGGPAKPVRARIEPPERPPTSGGKLRIREFLFRVRSLLIP